MSLQNSDPRLLKRKRQFTGSSDQGEGSGGQGPGDVEMDLSDETQPSRTLTVSAETKLILRRVKESPNAYSPLKSVAEVLCFVLDNCEQTEVNGRAIELLAPRVRVLSRLLSEPISPNDVNEKPRAEELERKLKEVGQAMDSMMTQEDLARFLKDPKNSQKLDDLVEDIRDALMDYQTSLQQEIYDKSCQLIGNEDRTLLSNMPHTDEAGYRSGNRQGCLRGTRGDVLLQLEHWLKDEQDHRVFWLNGLAGTGKSTIAQTFAETSFADGNLGASFFCSRDFEARRNLQAIFPTIAFQLSYRFPLFREQLLRVLRATPGIGQESLSSQMERVIVGPLKATRIRTLIIIDALDECKDEEPASAILSVLSRYVEKIPQVKFFITGRPEPRIRSGFRLKSLRPVTEVLRLHDVERSSVDSDIKLFFRTRLADIAKTQSDCDLIEDWPSPSDIDILCQKAAGLFIYASTVVKFVASKYHSPIERLAIIISLPQSTAHEGKSGIDLLYSQVLEEAFCDVGSNEEVYPCFRSAMGVVLLVFNPLPTMALSTLLGMSDITILHSPHSVLLFPKHKANPIQAFHKSFPDFLMDPGRCKDKRFFINPSFCHKEILYLCLNLMKERLRKDICNLGNYTLSEVRDIGTCRKEHIGAALEYACQFWTKHLMCIPSSDHDSEEVYKAVNGFFTVHLLFWIEVLIIMGNLDIGVHAINDVRQWYNSAGFACKWADDSQRFILENFHIIHDSPFKMYHSALPFTPSKSWLHEYYSPELLQVAKVVKGLWDKWGTWSRTVTLEDRPRALTCAGGLVAIGFGTGKIITLDAITGVQISVLSGHTDYVNSIAFSLDGGFLVSGSDDRTIKLWDIQTGGVIKTFEGHTDWVRSIAISPNQSTIASGSRDKTIRLWNTQTGDCYCILSGHNSNVNFISFFPSNPQLLISASDDNTVRQWNTSGYQFGPAYKGNGVAVSPDGTCFVSWKGTAATIQSSNSGLVVAKLRVYGYDFQCCCFSPNGKSIAGGVGHTIYIWDITSSDPPIIETFVSHADYITSLVFSSSLISLSSDRSIKFWEIGTSTDSEPTLPTSAPVASVSLQADDGIALSSNHNGVVTVWDLSTGLPKASFNPPVESISGEFVWRLVDNRLIVVSEGCIWDSEGRNVNEVHIPPPFLRKRAKISGDGSKIFALDGKSINALSIKSAMVMGQVYLGCNVTPDSLIVNGSKVWASYKNLQTWGWDFEVQGQILHPPPRYHLNFTGGSKIEDAVTGREILQFPGKYAMCAVSEWDGWYLIAGYDSGEVAILDFTKISL